MRGAPVGERYVEAPARDFSATATFAANVPVALTGVPIAGGHATISVEVMGHAAITVEPMGHAAFTIEPMGHATITVETMGHAAFTVERLGRSVISIAA